MPSCTSDPPSRRCSGSADTSDAGARSRRCSPGELPGGKRVTWGAQWLREGGKRDEARLQRARPAPLLSPPSPCRSRGRGGDRIQLLCRNDLRERHSPVAQVRFSGCAGQILRLRRSDSPVAQVRFSGCAGQILRLRRSDSPVAQVRGWPLLPPRGRLASRADHPGW